MRVNISHPWPPSLQEPWTQPVTPAMWNHKSDRRNKYFMRLLSFQWTLRRYNTRIWHARHDDMQYANRLLRFVLYLYKNCMLWASVCYGVLCWLGVRVTTHVYPHRMCVWENAWRGRNKLSRMQFNIRYMQLEITQSLITGEVQVYRCTGEQTHNSLTELRSNVWECLTWKCDAQQLSSGWWTRRPSLVCEKELIPYCFAPYSRIFHY